MPMTKIWKAAMDSLMVVGHHVYTGHTLTAYRNAVRVDLRITEGGREKGREVAMVWTPEEARAYASTILELADRAEKLNAQI